jgi:hypothetical protein
MMDREPSSMSGQVISREVADIALSPFGDGKIETTGVSAEIPIYSLAG